MSGRGLFDHYGPRVCAVWLLRQCQLRFDVTHIPRHRSDQIRSDQSCSSEYSRGVACMTYYRRCMPHIDHMRTLNIDPGLAAYLSNILFDLYTLITYNNHLVAINSRTRMHCTWCKLFISIYCSGRLLHARVAYSQSFPSHTAIS